MKREQNKKEVKEMKKLGIGVLALALLFIIVPAQLNADSGENEIKVGILSHLTGVLAGIGIPFHPLRGRFPNPQWVSAHLSFSQALCCHSISPECDRYPC